LQAERTHEGGAGSGFVRKAPHALDVTEGVRRAGNEFEIRVVNIRVKRQIGDASLPEGQRIAPATWGPFQPADPLVPSGLPGPLGFRHAEIP
jgi:hypothetical protein